ncbi:MAG: cbb3-type cytochrome c oxidase subunit II, partial [Rhodospirillales bacterium]|nr:cbb3-type cytochrome c oxidase subunit II [Rhodospirillales bacterium]
VGGRYSDDWHVAHMKNPRSLVPESIMPGYPFLAKTPLKYDDIAAHLAANRTVGVPYTDAMIAKAVSDVRTQTDPDSDDGNAFMARYPKAQQRDFDANPKMVSELDALIAYMQMLGTLVDFSGYKADSPENRR